MKARKNDLIMQNKIFLMVAALAGFILMIPLTAMQFTNEVNWNLADFVIMGALLLAAGFTFVALARVVPKKYRLLITILCALTLLWIWAELAVGVFTNLGS